MLKSVNFSHPLSIIARLIYILSVNQASDVKEPAALNGYVIWCYGSTVSSNPQCIRGFCFVWKIHYSCFWLLLQSHCQSSAHPDAVQGKIRMMAGLCWVRVGLSFLVPVRVVRFPSIHSPYWGSAFAWLLYTDLATSCNPLSVAAVRWYKTGFAPVQLTLGLHWDKLHWCQTHFVEVKCVHTKGLLQYKYMAWITLFYMSPNHPSYYDHHSFSWALPGMSLWPPQHS